MIEVQKNTEVLRRMAKQVDKVKVKLWPKGLNHSNPIILFSFFADLRMKLNNAAVLEDAAVWIISHFLRETTRHEYQAWISSPEDARKYLRRKGDMITTYHKDVHYLLSTYATSEVINEADYSVLKLVQEKNVV